MENATRGKRNFNDVLSLLHGRLPEYPIAQRFLEIGFEISACANNVYQAFLLPLLKRLSTRLAAIAALLMSSDSTLTHVLFLLTTKHLPSYHKYSTILYKPCLMGSA